ncbi:DMT family transporter [Segetibacter sp.]|uniref:DMT family transporter n=1 Tax=Segetibacter sp. TaxID=2231182 RepID=UPI00262A1BC0|nr:DMT family transporter [Segetibacter sp.]MCW3079284.1 putative superfamily transporter inner rane protein [Segetibacter sp.]
MGNSAKAHFSVMAANLIFAANYSIVKIVTPSIIKPFGLNVLRALVSVFMFWGLYLMKPSKPGIRKEDLGRFIICAATGIVINQLLFIKGLSLTTSIHASLLSLGTPVFITIIAAWLLKEKLTINKIAGLMLAIAGGVLLITAKEFAGHGSDIFFGDMLVLINAISYGFFLVLVRPLMDAYSPIHVLRWVFTLGTLMILLFGWNQFLEVEWKTISSYHWVALGFITIGATFLAYLLNVYGIKTLGSSATGTYIYTQPVFAAVIAALAFGEGITITKIISALLIFAGVFVVNINMKDESGAGIDRK